jgi:hypothetical protein
MRSSLKHVLGFLALLACSKAPKQHQPIEMAAAGADAPIGQPAVADAVSDATYADAVISDATPADAAVSDAIPANAVAPLDAAPSKRPTASKRSRRDACLKECERRNRYTDCGNEDGMGPCPCNCP